MGIVKTKERARTSFCWLNLNCDIESCLSECINKDLKTWSIGRVESHEGRSYVVATEEGRLVSHNQVHLCNVSFGMPTTSLNKSLVPMLDMPIKPLNTNNQTSQPTIKPKPKAKQSSPVSTPPKVKLRTRSGRLVKKPPR